MNSYPIYNVPYSNFNGGFYSSGRVNRPSRRRGRRNNKRRGRSGISYLDIVKKLKNDYRALFNVEDKYLDTVVGTTVNNTGFTQLLNGLTQGNGVSNRVGDSIRIVNLIMNLSFTISASATTTFIRCIIFVDNESQGAAPSAFTNLLISANYNALYNPAYSRRFKTQFDELVALNSGGDECVVYSRDIKLNYHPRYGLGNAGTVADIATGSLYFVAISDQGTNLPAMQLNIRIMYVDN